MYPLKRQHSRTAIALVGLAAIFLFITVIAAQSFRVTSVQITNDDVRITWDAPGGSNYVVQTATNLALANFADLSPVMFVAGSSVISTNYTHTGVVMNLQSSFYRVKASSAPILQIYPTNAVIGVTMTNRYQVFLVYPGNSTQDVTFSATLTASGNVAQTNGLSPDGFALVRGTNVGTGSVRAIYQGISNSVPLTVAQLTGMIIDPPVPVSGYVQGGSTKLQVFGIFSNGQSNNITPSSLIAGGAAGATRVDYRVREDVANSYALITGQSAADDSVYFAAADQQTAPIAVQWCQFQSVTLSPDTLQISVGQTQQVSVIGHMADGSVSNVAGFINSVDSIGSVASMTPNSNGVEVVGTGAGYTGLNVYLLNPVNCDTLSAFGSANVELPPSPPTIVGDPVNRTAILHSNATFNVTASGFSPLFYQWDFNGTNIRGAVGGSFTVTNASHADEGAYRAIVTNAYGSATSAVAILTVADVTFGPDAQLLWAKNYNGPGNDDDVPLAIAIDTNDNVFVTGESANNNISPITYDIATVKYSKTGLPLWTNRYNGPGNGYDYAEAIATDAAGNVFVTGAAGVSGDASDYMTIKYSNSGARLWTNSYNGPGNSNDVAFAIALDTNGNVFVTGYATVAGGTRDYATIKYSNSGARVWTNRYNGPANSNDTAAAIAVDGNGNILVTGYTAVAGGAYDYATIKYSNAGVPLWTNRYNGPGNSNDYAEAIAVDGSNNVFVTGSSFGNGSAYDYATIKYSGSGAPLWTNCYNGNGNGNDSANAIAVDNKGNVMVTGYANNGSSSNDYVTIKYSSEGIPLWTNVYNGIGNSDDYPAAIVVDGDGNIVVTGSSIGLSFGDYDYATIKYSPTGAILWLGRYHGPAQNVDFARGLVLDSRGNAIVTGSSVFSGLNEDYGTIKYSFSCFARWDFNSVFSDQDTTTGVLSPSLGIGTVSYVGGTAPPAFGQFAGGSLNDPNSTDNSSWYTSFYPAQGTANKSAGVQFNVSTAGDQGIQVTWDQSANSTGSKYVRFQYSTNGVDFVDFPTANSVSSINFESQNIDLSGIAGVDNNSNFAFRIVAEFESTAIGTANANYAGAAAGYGTSGTIRFDIVTVSGTPNGL